MESLGSNVVISTDNGDGGATLGSNCELVLNESCDDSLSSHRKQLRLKGDGENTLDSQESVNPDFVDGSSNTVNSVPIS